MDITLPTFNLKKLKDYADWKLLVFLLLFLNVKLAIKIPVLALMYLLQFNWRFGFSFKNSRLPLFYPLIIGISIIAVFPNRDYTAHNYQLVFVTGIAFWLMCILAAHQIKLSVERNDAEVIHHTLLLFFIINAAVSFFNLAAIIWETGAINPYTYQGEFQKYFIGTGDYIKGLSFDTSTTNAILNAFGVVYFLSRKNVPMVMLCMTVLLFTGSNTTNIIIVAVLALLFIFRSDRIQKSAIAICFMLLAVFMAKISPQNNGYTLQVFANTFHFKKENPVIPAAPLPRITERPGSTLNAEEKRQKIATLHMDSLYRDLIQKGKLKPQAVAYTKEAPQTETGRIYIVQPNLNLPPYQELNATPPEQLPLVSFAALHRDLLPLSGKPFHWVSIPGKVTGMVQTVNFLCRHPAKIFLGDGMGNFSSKLAFRASGLGVSGKYAAKDVYISPEFLRNHLDLYINYFSRQAGYHSLINSPYSVYDQLISEYGLLGITAFALGYVWFFAKHLKTLTYGLPVLLIILSALFTDYWFEQLSIMVFFELLLFLDIKTSTPALQTTYAK